MNKHIFYDLVKIVLSINLIKCISYFILLILKTQLFSIIIFGLFLLMIYIT
jgi:hypothetical protein